MSLAGHRPKFGSSHVLYKGDKGVNDAASPLEGGPAEVGGLLVSSLPVNIDRPARMADSTLKSFCTKQRLVKLHCWEEVGICRWSHRADECGTRLF